MSAEEGGGGAAAAAAPTFAVDGGGGGGGGEDGGQQREHQELQEEPEPDEGEAPAASAASDEGFAPADVLPPPDTPAVLATGGYDHTIRLWQVRMRKGENFLFLPPTLSPISLLLFHFHILQTFHFPLYQRCELTGLRQRMLIVLLFAPSFFLTALLISKFFPILKILIKSG